MKKLLWNLLRWGIPAAIIAWLVSVVVRDKSFSQLWDEPKHWDLLALATLVCFLATLVTILRWYFLVRAVSLPLRLRDTIRLGFLGYLYNFVLPGGVGGDLVKVGFLIREQPGRRTEAALTVLVDRIVGLYGLFLLASGAILFTGMWHFDSADVRLACRVIFWCAGISTLLLAVSAMPGFSQGPVSRWLHGLPRVGPFVERLNRATRMYYRHWSVLPFAVALTIFAQVMYAISFWLIARGLLSDAPSLGENLVVVPMAMITGVLPLAPNGLGTFEWLVELMYHQLMGTAAIAGAGFIVSLGYRLVTIVIAIVGAVIFFVNRREVSAMIHEAEEEIAEEQHAAEVGKPAAST
ncbi:MAG TPA: lysylphosphatidylglycerol synthase transmembrane domain-containing protein [Pirellulales bacterium]|nr:lysylphosphatidylglycerol synthase transmembrane domain-containing protein [Pirellulales bacterium]